MKAAESKTTTASQPLQAKTEAPQPFFQPQNEQQGAFFGQETPAAKPFFSPFIQTKLSIGQPGDKYEQEADAMAEQVVQRLSSANEKPIQRKCSECEQEEQLQKKETEEEEPLMAKIQKKPIFESNEEPVKDQVQRKCAACEAEKIQPMCIQRMREEEEPEIQAKADVPNLQASADLENRLNATKGDGSPLPENTRDSMESTFGANFGNVRVHTTSSAVQMNQELGAQAFTHGSDIYFNSGKYSLGSTEGERLLGHELTHVVQQTGKRIVAEAQRIHQSSPVRIARQNGSGSGGGHVPTVVNLIRISCESNNIEFYTDAGVFIYELTECELGDFDYTATVTVAGDNVNFTPPPDDPGAFANFRYRIAPGRPNPSTFFPSQTTVRIVTGTLSPQGTTPSSPTPSPGSAGPIVCARPLDVPVLGRLANHAFVFDPTRGANYAIRFLVSGNGFRGCSTKTDASPAPDTPTTSTCKPCAPKPGETINDVSSCLKNVHDAYASPNLYMNMFDPNDGFKWGPNSNSYAAALAKCCADSSPSGLGNVPGWNHTPAPPCSTSSTGTPGPEEETTTESRETGGESPSSAEPADAGLPGGVPQTNACKPTFNSLEATKTGNIQMTTAWGNCELAFGAPGGVGMSLRGRVDVPAGCSGTLEYLQLIDRCLQKRTTAGVDERLNTGGFVLDTSDPYSSMRITTPGVHEIRTNDSPGGGFAAGNNFLFANDRFKMWLMWTPDSPTGAPRVPLAMVTWNWTAKANKTGGTGCAPAWTISDDLANGGRGAATNTSPTWSSMYPGTFSYGPGVC